MAVALEQSPLVQPTSRRSAIRRALRQPSVAIGLLILLLFLFAALLAPLLAPADPLAQNVVAGLHRPTPNHLLGTDKLAATSSAAMFYGARISLAVGVAVVALAGAVWGCCSACWPASSAACSTRR